MTQKIGIGVEAIFDPSGVAKGVEQIGQQINKLNQKQLNPVSDKAVKQLDAVNQKFQQLLRVDAELRRRMKATGQQDSLVENIDWAAMHTNKASSHRKMEAVQDYLGISRGPGHTPPPAPPSHPGRGGGSGGSGGNGPGIIAGAAQAGLRAAGPAGGVAAGALGTGMSAGAGAGLMGLMGGLLALGVGKIVGSVMENIGKAEDNDVGYDKLKRAIGDVSVSFDGLKSVIMAGADGLKITYSEMSSLSSQYARAGNLQGGQYTSLPGEVGVGVGLSRGFGLDPSQGVGLMGQMRGMKITNDVNESRKFAILIGETIGKSGAFAKADEVMQAIGGYAESQTRASMGGANVSGYGGMFSAMVGSGIPGMDPSGAGAMLGRINAALSAGGAKGEASQFMTARVGAGMGLDPLQTQVLREGGAFATNNGMFGSGSAYGRYMGKAGPGGGKTFLQGTIDAISQQYGGNSDDDKLLRAQAFANHAGINMNQSMAMLSLKPNEMGGMEKYAGDITKLNAGGIANLAKVVNGSDADRQGVADSLLRRKDLSENEKRDVTSVMEGKDVEAQKQILGALVASHDQERTQGSDIRDSKNALDNIKTAIADKLVPLTLEMRHGIMSIAGGGTKSSEQIMADVVRLDSKERAKAIEGRFAPEKGMLEERQNTLEAKRRSLDPVSLATTYRDKPEILEKKLKERADVMSELTFVEKRLKEIEDEKAALLKKENERREKELADVHDGVEARWASEAAAGGGPGGPRGSGGGSGGGKVGPVDPAKRDEAMKFFMDKGWSKEQAAGIVANLGAESGLSSSIVGDGGQAYGIAQWHPDRQQNFANKYGKDIKGSSYREQLEFVNYELTEGKEKAAGDLLRKQSGAGASGNIVSRYYERPKNADGDAAARSAYAEKIAATPMPMAFNPGRGEDPRKFMFEADPLVVQFQDQAGREIRPRQTIQTRVSPAGQSFKQ